MTSQQQPQTKIAITPRVLKEAERQTAQVIGRINVLWARQQVHTWDELQTKAQISIPDIFKTKPLAYSAVSELILYLRNSTRQRLELTLSVQPSDRNSTIVKVDHDVETFHQTTLKPEQQGCYAAIYEHFITRKERAALQDGYTGVGKTIIACAVIARMVKSGILKEPDVFFRPHPFVIFTPKGVAEAWRRELELAGLGDLLSTRQIYVFPDSELSSSAGAVFVKENVDEISDETSIDWNPALTPILGIIDESHRYVNRATWRTKALLSMILNPVRKHVLLLSATPMEKVNDAYLFALACNTTLMGTKITQDSFPYFASLLDSTPNKPNREACKRLRKVLSPYIFSVPYIKPKYKAINVLQIVPFRNEQDRHIYDTAQARYVEACIKSGKNAIFGPMEKFVALNNYRKTVEPLRAYWMSQRCAENYRRGQTATAVFTAFKETIAQVAFDLVDKYDIPRSAISIVWGGRKEYRAGDILSQTELDNIIKQAANDLSAKIDPAMLKRIRMTLRYMQDKEEHLESSDEQARRHDKLKALHLTGKQTDNMRQIEVDRYQNGETQILLATIAIGGVGLSFDRAKPHVLPREGLFTPIYSGKEFQQALGRLVRRMSLSDALQIICMMKDSVEEWHVAPILDEKLKCIAEITARTFNAIHLLARTDSGAAVNVRDIQQATLDAEKDDTIVSEFTAESDDDETEEDEELITETSA